MFSTALQCLCAIGVIQAACALRMPSGTLAQGQATAGGSTQSQYMYVQHAMHKKHGKHHGHHHHGHSSDSSVCEEGVWREKVLKLVHEIPVAGLFEDLKGHSKFEASGITHVNRSYVVVFDSLQELGVTGPNLEYKGSDNFLAGDSGPEPEYEAICHRSRTDTLLAIHEGEQDGDVWFAKSIEVRINEDQSVTYLSTCKVDFALPEGNKKGWEGAEYVDKGDEGEFLLGVCEGNHCQGSKGRGKERGNGRIVVTKLVEDAEGCKWETQKLVKLPPFFKDYSDIDITASGRVAVSSQEDSAVWVGQMNMTTFEIEGEGTTLHFPRSADGCQPIYCNIEGVHFIDDVRIMTVSDKAKRDQHWQCVEKDQSVQIFALPSNVKPGHLGTSL